MNKKNDEKITKLLPDIFCIEAAALAHDLGHPPNGHGGEHALNYLMLNHGGFEGNAQTFRIATKLEESTKNWGLGLTRATLLGMLKYPAFYILISNILILKLKNNSLNFLVINHQNVFLIAKQKF